MVKFSLTSSLRSRRCSIFSVYCCSVLLAGLLSSGDSRRLARSAFLHNKADDGGIMRAWTCHGRNQKDLVDRMMQAGIIRNDAVRDVLYQVDRKNFIGNKQQQVQQQVVSSVNAYMDAPQAIGLGQTISAPHIHAHALEEIYPFLKSNDTRTDNVKILDVGCGSGYLTTAFGRWLSSSPSSGESSVTILQRTGRVFGIDVHPSLVANTRHNMEQGDKDLLTSGLVTLQVGDGWKGLPEESPFDVIHVGAAAAEFPKALFAQLKVGGVLIIPIGPEGGAQILYRIERHGPGLTEADFKIKELLGVRFVPLVKK